MNYDLRHGNGAQLPKVQTTSFGIETIANLGSRLWQLLPQEIKQSNTCPIKKQIKCWIDDECDRRLCKKYIPKVGFQGLVATLSQQQSLLFRFMQFVLHCCCFFCCFSCCETKGPRNNFKAYLIISF